MDLKETLKSLKVHESTVSMIFGALIIVVVGVVLIKYLSNNKVGQTIPPIEVVQNTPAANTHIVAQGEDLWSIAVKYYGNGNRWIEIANENNLQNPNDIKVGQALTIPENKELASATGVTTPSVSNTGSPTPTITLAVTTNPTPTTELPPVDTQNNGSEYVVQKGDTLWQIAEDKLGSGFKWKLLADSNNITDARLLETGTKLTISRSEQTTGITQNAVISGSTYTVVKGDNLWDIAVRAYGDGFKWVEIARENNLSNPKLIYSGNKLSLAR